ncbi:MAG: hypothetical protein BGO98_36745 [Myxococcales bacterium 68-20]|nr:MAG: hypothetical protein BGO98_36745 [Myxococcales bacterium 68-20]
MRSAALVAIPEAALDEGSVEHVGARIPCRTRDEGSCARSTSLTSSGLSCAKVASPVLIGMIDFDD